MGDGTYTLSVVLPLGSLLLVRDGVLDILEGLFEVLLLGFRL